MQFIDKKGKSFTKTMRHCKKMQFIYQNNARHRLKNASNLPKKCKSSTKRMQIIDQKMQIIYQNNTSHLLKMQVINQQQCKSSIKKMQVLDPKTFKSIDQKMHVIKQKHANYQQKENK